MSILAARLPLRRALLRTAAALGVCASMSVAPVAVAHAQRVAPVLPAVEFRATSLDGKPIHVGDRQGLTLVNVFATWCTTCKTEFSDLERLSRELGTRVAVVAVSIDDGSDDKVRRFVASQRATFAVAHDSSGTAARVFRTVGVPESYLVGRDGRILWHRAGEIGPAIPSLRQAIGAAR